MLAEPKILTSAAANPALRAALSTPRRERGAARTRVNRSNRS
jgi:hypothetical protein